MVTNYEKKTYFQKGTKKLAPPPKKKKVHAQGLKYYSLCEVLSFQEVSQESLKYWRSYRHLSIKLLFFLIGDIIEYLQTVIVARIFVILLI